MKFKNFRERKSDLKSAPSKQDPVKILLRLDINTLWPRMPKFRDLGSTFLKTNNKFEISTSEIGYMGNFVKIRSLILFGQKCPNLGIWAQNLKNKS